MRNTKETQANRNVKVKPKQFHRNNARTGHPAYIVKIYERKGIHKAEFIGITGAKETHGVKNIKLDKNPNPKNINDSYIRPNVDEVNLTPNTFGKKLKDWEFSITDKKKVNKVIKKSARR